MAECKKYFRSKERRLDLHLAIMITRRNKKVCLQDFLDRMNGRFKDNENRIYCCNYIRQG